MHVYCIAIFRVSIKAVVYLDGRGLSIRLVSAFTPFRRLSSTLLQALSHLLTQQATGSYQNAIRWARNLQLKFLYLLHSIYFPLL